MRLRNVAAALVALGLIFSSAGGVLAQEPGQDEVTLKNGGSVRGTIVSSEPGTSVKIIEMGQTQARVIPWSQVSDVEKGKYAPRTDAQPGPAGPGYGYGAAPQALPMPQAAPPPPEGKMGDLGVVRLHVESPVPATIIEERSAVVGAYGAYGIVLTQQRGVCSSPCDKIVDGTGGRRFTLAHADYPPPLPFTFTGLTGDVTLHVEPGSHGRRIGGVLAIVFGATAAVAGAIIIPIALASSTTDLNTDVTVNIPDKGLRNAGIGFLAGGLAAIGGGIALVRTAVTRVRIEPRGAEPASPGETPEPPSKAAQIQPRYWMGEF